MYIIYYYAFYIYYIYSYIFLYIIFILYIAVSQLTSLILYEMSTFITPILYNMYIFTYYI